METYLGILLKSFFRNRQTVLIPTSCFPTFFLSIFSLGFGTDQRFPREGSIHPNGQDPSTNPRKLSCPSTSASQAGTGGVWTRHFWHCPRVRILVICLLHSLIYNLPVFISFKSTLVFGILPVSTDASWIFKFFCLSLFWWKAAFEFLIEIQ